MTHGVIFVSITIICCCCSSSIVNIMAASPSSLHTIHTHTLHSPPSNPTHSSQNTGSYMMEIRQHFGCIFQSLAVFLFLYPLLRPKTLWKCPNHKYIPCDTDLDSALPWHVFPLATFLPPATPPPPPPPSRTKPSCSCIHIFCFLVYKCYWPRSCSSLACFSMSSAISSSCLASSLSLSVFSTCTNKTVRLQHLYKQSV